MSPVADAAAFCLAVFLLVNTSMVSSTRNEIKLVNNGYENILVAIGEAVPLSQRDVVIDRIKLFFKAASKNLFRATYNRVYFRDITILVPKSWGNRTSYDEATTETFNSANVVIDGQKIETPTTWTYGACGEPGEYMQLPIGYTMTPLGNITREFGYPGATIVHEWGHLRWGLKDEYPVAGKPSFYRSSDEEVTAVKCGKFMKGKHVDYTTGGPCDLVEDTGLPSTTCYFWPHDDPEVEASMMFYHNVSEVTTFCDDDENNPRTLHNDEAPSLHNDLCDGRSAWEVMRDHDDFRDGNSSTLDRAQDTTPSFRIVQAKNKRIVLVLDVSGSMGTRSNDVTRIEKLNRTSTDYLMNVIPSGYHVGIVTFNNDAYTNANLTEITPETREELLTKLPRSVGGSTGIGGALLKGVEVLESNDRPASGGILILVSDGMENNSPMIANVTPTLIKKGVVVNTILISDSADEKLVQLSAFTKGKSFFDSGSSNSTQLQSAFRATVKDSESGYPGATPVELLLETVTVNPGEDINKFVFIDPSIGRDTVFTVSYTGTNFNCNVTVVSPSGISYTATGPNGRRDVVLKQVVISVKEAKAGRWMVVMQNNDDVTTSVQLLVTSKAPTDASYPITTTAFLSQQNIDFNDTSTLKLIVRAEIKRGYSPLIGAKVEVQVGTSPWKLMTDDGQGVDVLKDDGFYSAILLSFQKNGFNPVKVRAKASDGNETRLLTSGGNRAFRLVRGNAAQLGPTYERVAGFDRTSDAGVVNVANLDLTTDLKAVYPFPPAKVADLKVIDISFVNKTVTLKWTAVGDFEEQERASSYDIRFSTNIKQLRYSFENASQIDDNLILSGNRSGPLAPSETETFVIRFPAAFNTVTLFFGIKVVHSNTGRVSKVSNIVSAAIVYVPPKDATSKQPTTRPTLRPTAPTSAPTSSKNATPKHPPESTTGATADSSAETLLLIKLILGTTPIVLVIIIAAIIKLKYSRKTRQSRDDGEDGLSHRTRGTTRQYGGVMPYNRGNMRQYGGVMPYTHPLGTTSVVRSVNEGYETPVYHPTMDPYQVNPVGHIQTNRYLYGYSPYHAQRFS